MKFAISGPHTNAIVRRSTLQLPMDFHVAGIDVTDEHTGNTHFAQILCFGRDQEEADHIAAEVFAALHDREANA